jgi:hypothetical protein
MKSQLPISLLFSTDLYEKFANCFTRHAISDEFLRNAVAAPRGPTWQCADAEW